MGVKYKGSVAIGRNSVEEAYLTIKYFVSRSKEKIIPFIRRIERFVALPYCFIFHVSWDICTRSKVSVAGDFLYIFFVLKCFPDFYNSYRLWEKPRSEWGYYYGSTYDCYQRKALRKVVLREKYEVLYEDKKVCDALCREAQLPLPLTLGFIKKGSSVMQWCNELKLDVSRTEYIAKPLDGKGGHGIYFLNVNTRIITDANGEAYSDVVVLSDYIVQEKVVQHKALSNVAKSLNTVRYVTLIKTDGTVLPISCLMRFGNGLSLTDNISQPGGIAIPINIDTGMSNGYGIDFTGRQFEKHPKSKIEFKKIQVPMWSEVQELAVKTHLALDYCLLVGMDIAISEKGPVLIEVNSIYDNILLEMASGPLLKDKDVLSAFGEHGLLFNKFQKKILKEGVVCTG